VRIGCNLLANRNAGRRDALWYVLEGLEYIGSNSLRRGFACVRTLAARLLLPSTSQPFIDCPADLHTVRDANAVLPTNRVGSITRVWVITEKRRAYRIAGVYNETLSFL
jgi:hypothetical protein